MVSSVDLSFAVSHQRSDKQRNDVQIQRSFVDPSGSWERRQRLNSKMLSASTCGKSGISESG
jgi:hypothetical protein